MSLNNISVFIVLQGCLEKPTGALRQRCSYRPGDHTSWPTTMAILHPSVFYALWGGHCETLPSLNVLHFKGEYRQRSKHISKFFVRNSTLHIIAICRFNKKVKECKAGIRKGHKNLANFQNSFQVYYSKIELHLKKISFFNIIKTV